MRTIPLALVMLRFDEQDAGQILREASLEDVEHYFVYNADRYAEAYLA